jgi:hypothetical protein
LSLIPHNNIVRKKSLRQLFLGKYSHGWMFAASNNVREGRLENATDPKIKGQK